MAKLDETPIIDLGKSPIPGPAPCGEDAAEDPQYINILAELSKMDRIEGEAPQWYQVEQDCINLLKTKSKDMEVAVALGHALFKRSGYAGLAAALALFKELIANFWDGLFPERPRRRKARIEALSERLSDGGWFRESPPKPDEFEAINLCLERAELLKTALVEKMPDEPPDFGKFTKGLKDLAAKKPQPAAPPAPGAGAPGGGGGSFSAGEVADAGSAVNAIMAAATFLRKADPTDAIAYAVVRVIKWAKITLPTSEAAKFQIEPPEASKVEALVHQSSNALWDHLLQSAESAFRSSDPLWLDLQKYVCTAMTGLGPPFEKARQAVLGVTAGLVRRLGAGLYELTFRGGMPLCSGETRMWIESEVAPAPASGGASLAAGNGKLTESSDKARKLAGEGKLKEALQELQDGLLGSAQRRDRLLWKLRMAQLCFDAKRFQLAGPLLEECHDEVRRYHIDEWEPALAVDVAQSLYRCRKSVTSSEKEPPREAVLGVRESFAWLCQLDPLAALAADPAGK